MSGNSSVESSLLSSPNVAENPRMSILRYWFLETDNLAVEGDSPVNQHEIFGSDSGKHRVEILRV